MIAVMSTITALNTSATSTMPKGAGHQVREAARDIIENLGEDALPEFVKTHFKTTADVLGNKKKNG